MEQFEKDENIQRTIEYGLQRVNILLQLRYQVALAIIALIAGIWAVIFPSIFVTQNTNIIFFFGWIITIFLITSWRVFTHFIFQEEVSWNVNHLVCLNKLGTLTDENVQLSGIAERLELNDNGDFRSFDIIKKIVVLEKLKRYTPENGLNTFDDLSIDFIIGLGVFLYFQNLINGQILIPITLLCTIIILGLVPMRLPFKFWTELKIHKTILEVKNADKKGI